MTTTKIIIVLICLVLAACTPTAPVAEEKSILIGLDLPLTGVLSIYGQPLLEGLQLGTEEINAVGGVNGKPLTLIAQDNEGKPATAATAAQKLIEEDNINILFSAMVGPTGAIAPLTEKNKKILSYVAAADTFAEQNHYVFKDSVDSFVDCTLLGRYAKENKLTHVALFGAQGEFTLKCAEALNNTGLTVTNERYLKGTDLDFRTPLTKIAATHPDALILSAYADDCLTIWREIKELGLHTTFLLPFTQTGCGDEQNTKLLSDIPSPIIGGQFIINKNSPKYTTFINSFREKYHKEPTLLFFTALGYDYAHYLAEALEHCPDSNDTDCIKTALEQTNHTGAWGTVTFNEKHASVRARELIEFKDGNWQSI